MSSNKNIPQLRFPEFTGEWEKKNLGKVIDVSKGQQVNRTELTEDTTMFPMLNGGSTPSGYYTKFNTPSDSITISEGGNSCGYINYMKVPFWAGGHCYVVKPLFDIDKKFIYHALKYNEPNIMRLRVGSGLPNIQRKTLLNEAYLFYPSEPSEQKKIAEFLSAMDDMIEAQGQRVEALKEKKKGLMQQMFPQKGETTPQLRFPEFTGEWKESQLKDVSIKIVDGSHNPPKGVGYSSNYLLSSQNIQDGYIVFSNARYLSDEDYIKENKRTDIKVGDVLLTIVGTIGRACVIKGNEGKIVFQRSVAVIKPNSCIHSYFLLYTLQNLNKALNSQAAGGAQKGIYLKQLEGFTIPLPSLPEQKKIAECLSAMDDAITSETAKLDALKEHKKGLMQRIFPQPTK